MGQQRRKKNVCMEELQLNQFNFQDIATTILHTGNSFCFKAHGSSMTPFIRDGDIVHLRKSPPYHIGDVVLLKNDQSLVLHRIIKKTTSGVITRGDASLIEDPGPIDDTDILGKIYKVAGRGNNFHLRFPCNYLMTTRFFSSFLFQNCFVRKIGKYLVRLQG